jgi:hypothetical protein
LGQQSTFFWNGIGKWLGFTLHLTLFTIAMPKIVFILKCLLANVAIALLIGLLAGGLAGLFVTEHPHQIFPTWLVVAVLAGLFGMGASLLVSGLFLLTKRATRLAPVLATNAALTLGWVALVVGYLVF